MSKDKCSIVACHKGSNQNLSVVLTGGAVAFIPLCWSHYKEYKDSEVEKHAELVDFIEAHNK